MKQLAKASAVLGIAQVLGLFFKVVNTKFLAVFLGPYGVGIFNQIIFFYMWVTLFNSLGTRQGIVKYVSEYNAGGDYEEIKKIVVTLGGLLFALSLVVAVISYFFAARISFLLFASYEYTKLVALACLAIPQTILMSFYLSLIYAFRPIKQISFFIVAESALAVLLLVPMVYFFGLPGAVANIILLTSCQLLMVWWIYHRYCPVKVGLRDFRLFELAAIQRVMNYGLVHLVVQVVQYLVLTILFRRLIITNLGIEANGIYSPAYGMSFQSMLIISATIYIYSFTKISEAKQLSEVRSEVSNLLRLGLLIMTPVFFVLISYRKFLIILLYTDKFLPVTQIMPIQFVGDFFRIIGLAVALPLLARANLKAMLGFDLSMYLIFYGLASVLVPKYGLTGAAVSYLTMYVLYLLAVLPYMRHYIGFRLEKKNYWLILLSFTVLIIAGRLDLGLAHLIPVTILLLGSWGMLSLTKEEKKYVREKMGEVLVKVRS